MHNYLMSGRKSRQRNNKLTLLSAGQKAGRAELRPSNSFIENTRKINVN